MEDDDSAGASNDLMPHLHDRGYRRAPSPVAIRGLSAPVNQPRTPRSRKHASSGDLDPSAVKWSARKQSLRETSIFVESATSTLSASDKRLDEQRAQAFRLQAELNIEAEKLHKESFMIAEERGQLFQRERALEVRAAELQAMQAEALLMQRKGADAFAAASVESQKISLREQELQQRMDSLSRSERAFETSCTMRERAVKEKETQIARERDELNQQRERFSVDVKKMERDVSDLRKTNEALVVERDRLRLIEAQLAEKQQELRRKERKHEKELVRSAEDLSSRQRRLEQDMAARSTVLTEQQQAIDQQKSTLRLREAAILRQEEGILQQHAAASQDASAAVQQAASIKAEYQQKLQELATRKESLDLLESELTARQRSHLVDVQSFTAKVEQHEQHWVSQMESLRQREAELQAQQADVRAQSEHLAQLDAQRSVALVSLRRANASSSQYDAQVQEALDEARQLHLVLANHQALESKFAALLKERDGCNASLQAASEALQAHEVEVRSLNATCFQLQQDKVQSERSRQDLQSKLLATEAALSSLHREHAYLQSQLVECERREADARRIVQSYKALDVSSAGVLLTSASAAPETAMLAVEAREAKSKYKQKLAELSNAKQAMLSMQSEFEKRVVSTEMALQARAAACEEREIRCRELEAVQHHQPVTIRASLHTVCLANVHIEPASAAASLCDERLQADRAMALQREILASREASLAQREQDFERARAARLSEWKSQEQRVQDVLRLQSDVDTTSRSISSRLKDVEGRERALTKKEQALQQQFESSKAEISRAFAELETAKRTLAATSSELLQKETVIQRASLELTAAREAQEADYQKQFATINQLKQTLVADQKQLAEARAALTTDIAEVRSLQQALETRERELKQRIDAYQLRESHLREAEQRLHSQQQLASNTASEQQAMLQAKTDAVRHEERRIETARLSLVQESEALQAERQSCQRERQRLKEQAELLAEDREEHTRTQRRFDAHATQLQQQLESDRSILVAERKLFEDAVHAQQLARDAADSQAVDRDAELARREKAMESLMHDRDQEHKALARAREVLSQRETQVAERELELVSRGSRAQRATVDEQTRVAELQRELHAHITEAQSMKDLYQRRSQEASLLQQQLLAKEQDMSNQLSDLQERQQALQQRESRLSMAEAALLEQQSSLKTSQQEFTSAKSKWESDRSVFTVKFEQQSSELQARLNAISRRETVNEQVQQDLERLRASEEATLLSKHSDLRQREEKLQQESVSIKAMEEEIARQQHELDVALAALQHREAQLDARMQDWSQQCSATEAANQARHAELSDLQASIEVARLKQEQQEKELSHHEAALMASQQQLDAERVSLQQQTVELQQGQRARSSALEQLDATKVRLDAFQASLEKEHAAIAKRAADLKAAEETFSTNRVEVEQHLAKTANSLKEMQSQLNAERQELSQARATLENERAESAAASLSFTKRETEVRIAQMTLESRASKLQTQESEFQEEVKRERENIASLRASLQSKQSSLHDETKKCETAIAGIAQRQALLVNLDAELQARAASLSQREQQLEVNERASAVAKSELLVQQQQLQDHEKQLHDRESDLRSKLQDVEKGQQLVQAVSKELDVRRSDTELIVAKRAMDLEQRAVELRASFEALQRREREISEAEDAQRIYMRQKSQEWDLKFSELSLKYKDLEARETALRALEQRLEEQEARQSSMSSDIAVREQRLQALSTRLVSRGDELESESRQWSVLTDRSSDVRRRTDDEFRSMHTSAMILHESAASDADTPLPAKRLPTASSHPTRSPTRPMSRIPDHPSSKHIRSALQSPGSSLTVDVIGNAASNVFRGIAVARRQSGELLNTVMSSLTSAPLQLQEVADTLQHEYLQLGKTLETHRSKLFELHADVQQLQDQLGSSSASDSSEIVSSLDLARAGLDSLLAELLIAQKQHEGLDDRLRFLAQSLSLPVTRRSGKAAVTVQHVGSSRDSSVAVSHDQHAVSGSAETATVDSAHDWLHTLGELGIPQTPRR